MRRVMFPAAALSGVLALAAGCQRSEVPIKKPINLGVLKGGKVQYIRPFRPPLKCASELRYLAEYIVDVSPALDLETFKDKAGNYCFHNKTFTNDQQLKQHINQLVQKVLLKGRLASEGDHFFGYIYGVDFLTRLAHIQPTDGSPVREDYLTAPFPTEVLTTEIYKGLYDNGLIVHRERGTVTITNDGLKVLKALHHPNIQTEFPQSGGELKG